ncbi:DNA-(apurinic or apyrimidinic site) lyase [Ligilactobacillus sp. WC1T17]|uniref:Formamidopyrimidine-DNA glycosylase n=1 Tax=Ligilactobacillus ruminis TaxID=1623 RepID=A0ABY1A9N9_9LACO|nr:DNA-(apurinic or apyrimidinic site) lyase [Ligilactobacillus ruminis]
MPELPEVETVRRGLEKLILGATVVKVDVFYPKMIVGDCDKFVQTLQNKTIEAVDRRGKYLLFRFSDSITMMSHLRMEGKYFVKAKGSPKEKHTHVIFYLQDGRQLHYNDVRKFGRMELFLTGQELESSSLKKLGPEPTEASFKLAAFYQALQSKHKNIKTALLDQTLVAGVGNIYADEVLWIAKIHPQTPCNKLTLDQADLLRKAIIEELAMASKAGGTTIRSYANAFLEEGQFQFALNVYGKKDQPCPRCQTPIVKIVVGQRGTHFCPKCQVLP